jgi:hypothetical protein
MLKEFRSTSQIIYLTIGVPILFFLFTSCGFAYEKHIIGKYYIVGVDDNTDLSLSYELSSGDYIGKAPGRLIEYGYNDTFLLAKTQEYNQVDQSYYIIDMRKDSELAHEETFRIGPISDKEFDSLWKSKLKIKMKRVQK